MEIAEYKQMDQIESDHPWFVAKRKFLSVVLDKYRLSLGRLKVLDVGCGTGAVMQFLAKKNFEVYGIDPSGEALKYCTLKGLSVKKSSAEKIDFSEDSFDVVFALDVLEHLENPELAVEEIDRVLKKGGIFIMTVPAHQWLWSYHDEFLHHKKRYNRKDIINLLDKKFEIVKISWIHGFILLPAMILRFFKQFQKNKDSSSDVKPVSYLLRSVMSGAYFLEVNLFKVFNSLPFGLSLLAVAKKR